MRRYILFSFFIFYFLLFTFYFSYSQNNEDLTKYVDPFIGTREGGNIFPGVAYPFGMIKLGPDCDELMTNMGWSEKDPVRGFSHFHISGTGGGPKYGNILVYPFNGDVRVEDYGSKRGKEKAEAGYYSIELTKDNILAELSCTNKTGIHRYTFSKRGDAGILIDAGSFLGKLSCCSEQQELVGSEVRILSNTEIEGYSRIRGGWNNGAAYTVYFYALFDTPALSLGTWKSGKIHKGNYAEYDSGEPVGAWFVFNSNIKNEKSNIINLKIGFSFISTGKAKVNYQKEAEGLSFEQAVEKAKAEWNKYLQRIKIETNERTEKVKFYTALYHVMMQPSERTGENPVWQSKKAYYDDYYCIWDTYRTNHPLITLFAPEKETDMVNSLLSIYEHEGYMPDARSGNYNGRTQGGSNCDMIAGEAILKELKGIDYELAYEAMLKDAEVPPGGDERKEGRGGLTDYKNLGYVSTNYERAGSRTVEYCANDWAIALSAKKLGKDDDFKKYKKRASNWENLWKPIEHDGAKGFIMPRKANGDWDENYAEPTWQFYIDYPPYKLGIIPYKNLPEKYLSHKPFTTLTGGSWPNFFYESESWEYSLYVPQDVKRLIEKCGGRDKFISRLDTFFKKNYYNITNEPGFLTPCLYIYADRHDKTAKLTHELLKQYYTDKPDGIPGNDDSGAMSSWFDFQTMGFFPVAGQDIYLIASPHYAKTIIEMGTNKKLEIIAENVSDKNIYISSAELNGKAWNKAWFRHSDIKDGAILKLKMSPNPSDWGKENPPPSMTDN